MITTASDLWTYWTNKNVLRPQDYDRDITDLVRVGLDDPSIPNARLARAMDDAAWEARDLIRAILPALSSFSGMLVDLLALYERVGATTTDKDNLRISYEFAPGVELDDRLAPFRETVRRTQTVMSEIEAYRFRARHAWNSPLRQHARDPLGGGAEALGIDDNADLTKWPFASDLPAYDLSDPALLTLATRHRQAIGAALARLSALGPTYLHVRGALHVENVPPLSESDLDLVQSASDFWAISEFGCLRELPAIVASLSPEEADALIQEHAAWLDGFWRTEVVPLEQQIEDLTDILSLPHWGQRFDLYSAWIAAAMDTVLAPHRLVFDVSDGVLAFPFRANLLARIATSRGPVELWSEKRFAASNLIGKGRTSNIQPDYVFIDSATSTVSAAVEAKQYKTAYSRNPGQAAHDYARNLPAATVLVVAHGPVRTDSIDLVASADRARVAFHPDVRPGSPFALARLRDQLIELLPLPELVASGASETEALGVAEESFQWLDTKQAATRGGSTGAAAGTVVLRWARTAHDLDLHLIDVGTREAANYRRPVATHASLGPDGFDGGPEYAVLHGTGSDTKVEVHLFSDDVATVQDARPTVTITTRRGSLMLAPPTGSVAARVWRVATVRADGSVTPNG